MDNESSLTVVGPGAENVAVTTVAPAATVATRRIGDEQWDDERIVEEFLAEKGRNSRNTAIAYRRDIDYYRAFLAIYFEGVGLAPGSLELASEYEAHLREEVSLEIISKSTANRRMSGLSSFYSWAAKAKRRSKTGIAENPVDFDSYKLKSNFNERVLEEAEVLRLIDAAANTSEYRIVSPARDAALIQFLYHSAGRVSEVVGLQWKHLKRSPAGGAGGVVHFFGKGGKERWVAVSENMWKKLHNFPCDRSPESYIFQCRNGGRINRQTILKIVERCSKKIGLENITPHVFRHTHATHAIRRGVDPNLLKQTMGHSSLAITSNYLKANPTDSSCLHLIT
jgi:site-specific recombinase XerD